MNKQYRERQIKANLRQKKVQLNEGADKKWQDWCKVLGKDTALRPS